MAVDIFAGNTTIGNQVASVTAPVPGSASGDMSVLFVYMYGSGTMAIPTPSGWTSLGFVAAPGSTVAGGAVFYRLWQPGDPASLVFAPGAGGVARILVHGFKLQGMEASLSQFSATLGWGPLTAGTPVPAPSVNIPAAGDMLITCHGGRNGGTSGSGGTWTAPFGMTELMDATTASATSANVSGLVSHRTMPAAGASGTQSAVGTVTLRGGSWSFIARRKTVTPTNVRMKGGAPAQFRYKGQP